MSGYEVDCDECGEHIEGVHPKAVKTFCIHCFKQLIRDNKELFRANVRLRKELQKMRGRSND